jgi:hypothetical protein
MRRLLACSAFAMLAAASFGCHNKKDAKNPKDNYDADAKSGPDAKRSGAQTLIANKPHTDEISYINQDATDWYRVELRGRPNPPVLTTKINWDNVNSDVLIYVYDEFGAEISASPVRDKGVTQKQLLTEIAKPGIYYIRVSAPTRADGTVYTMEALWAEPVVQAPPPPPPPVDDDKPVEEKIVKHRAPREPREPKPEGEKIQAHVVSAFRDGANLMMYIDKGSAAGIRVGNGGNVLQGSDGDDVLDGGEFRITRVIDANKSLGQATLRSLGKNNRVTITLGK